MPEKQAPQWFQSWSSGWEPRVEKLEQDVKTLKSDMKTLKQDVREIRQELGQIRHDMEHKRPQWFQDWYQMVQQDIQMVRETAARKATAEAVDELTKRLADIQSNVNSHGLALTETGLKLKDAERIWYPDWPDILWNHDRRMLNLQEKRLQDAKEKFTRLALEDEGLAQRFRALEEQITRLQANVAEWEAIINRKAEESSVFLLQRRVEVTETLLGVSSGPSNPS